MSTAEAPFGEEVFKEGARLHQEGKDPNQISNILCQKDSDGHNYGIGIILDQKGQPADTSSTLLTYAKAEIENSSKGSYFNSAKLMPKLKEEVLRWQRIPEKYWNQFILALPSDAGTGAVVTSVQLARQIKTNLTSLRAEKWGWPAYKAIAASAGLSFEESTDDVFPVEKTALAMYQAGPMNSTGEVRSGEIVTKRAQASSSQGEFVVLDRAYSGFEYAGALSGEGYSAVMQKSYEKFLEPFLSENVFFALALSPTKAFVTFSLRPCGLLLVRVPDAEAKKSIELKLSSLIRARGSSFEHPLTRAFVKSLVEKRDALEKEHEGAIRRLAEAEGMWKALSKGTTLEKYFTDSYAGLFRNVTVQKGAAPTIYQQHLYPVFSGDRCRLNVTGLPADEKLAQRHVQAFAQICL